MNSNKVDQQRRWLLALESSTAYGGAALLLNGVSVETVKLEEGLRHGRELLAAASGLLSRQALRAKDLWGVSVSAGPGSYTGLRVGVMAAKALSYGAGCRLATVSSLAALAETLVLAGAAGDGDRVMVLQDARRAEVYFGLYRIEDGTPIPMRPDSAIAPEEAADRLMHAREEREGALLLAGSGFATYGGILGDVPAAPAGVDPAAAGVLGWRQLLREESADPLQAQPVYLRRDAESDWRHDHLITQV